MSLTPFTTTTTTMTKVRLSMKTALSSGAVEPSLSKGSLNTDKGCFGLSGDFLGLGKDFVSVKALQSKDTLTLQTNKKKGESTLAFFYALKFLSY